MMDDSAGSDGDGSSGRSEEDYEGGSASGSSVSSDGISDSGSSDFRSSDAESYSSDEFDEGAYEHCVVNFCIGGYDAEIQAALENFSRDNPATGSDVEDAPVDASMVSTAREQFMQVLEGLPEHILHMESIGASAIALNSSHFGGQRACMVSDHRELAPLWESFFRVLGETNLHFMRLEVPKVELNEHVLERLAEHMKGRVKSSIDPTSITFAQNGIESPAQMNHLSALVEGNPTLKDLTICDNPITQTKQSTEATIRLCGTVRAHLKLDSISLAGCQIGDNLPALSAILKSGAFKIILNDNAIGREGAAAIADMLESDPESLERLELDKNRFDDDDAIRLSSALRKNTNLRELWVRRNRFTNEGAKTMFRAVYDTSSMNAIYDSNHFCRIVLFSTEREKLQDHIDFLNSAVVHDEAGAVRGDGFVSLVRDPEGNKRKKMMVALWRSSRVSMLRYLEDVPVELMPQVLDFIRTNTCGHKQQEQTRNAVHSIARWWNMPSLYAYRSCASSKATRKRRHPNL